MNFDCLVFIVNASPLNFQLFLRFVSYELDFLLGSKTIVIIFFISRVLLTIQSKTGKPVCAQILARELILALISNQRKKNKKKKIGNQSFRSKTLK